MFDFTGNRVLRKVMNSSRAGFGIENIHVKSSWAGLYVISLASGDKRLTGYLTIVK